MLEKTTQKIKEMVEFACAAVYALIFLPPDRRKYAVVLYYHDVPTCDLKQFEKQMRYLAGNCTMVKPSQIKESLANGHNSVVAITFDDAIDGAAKNAFEVLKKNSIPAALCVPVGCLGKRLDWTYEKDDTLHDKIVAEQAQVVQLDKDGFEIFSHGLSHRPLTDLPDDALEMEFSESRNYLQNILGHPVSVVSYPYGLCDDRVTDKAKYAGFTLGFTTDPTVVNKNTDDLRLGRFAADPADSLLVFKLKAAGAYQATRFLRLAKRFFFGSR